MSTSVLADSVSIGASTCYGEFCRFGEAVTIGENCQIGNHVIIHDGTMIGDNTRIDDAAVIGKLPMRAANTAVTGEQDLPPAQIGSGSIIGTNVVVYRGCRIGEDVLLADQSTIRENVTIGAFTIVGRSVAIENGCKVGRYVKLETNAYITAYSELGDRSFVAPCVATSNDNYVGRTEERFKHFKGITVKRGGRVGVNATVLPGVTVNEDSLVAAGALLTKDAPARKVVAGVPARCIGDVPEEQLLDNQGWED